MHFDESFFKAETIDDFYVSGMMKRYWASSMECLEEIDRICRKHKIRYFAYYGTLLGAVRHKGYIPWDDDMDIMMLRWDFDRFVKACEKELDPMLMLYNVEHSSVYPPRLTNTLYSRMEEPFLERFHYCPYPSGIDIYVMDKVPTNPAEAECVRLLHQIVRFVAQRTDRYFEFVKGENAEKMTDEELNEILDGIEEFTGTKIVRDGTIFIQMTKLANDIARMYNDTDSPYYARINNWAITGDNECIPKECFEKTEYIPFFDFQMPCPGDWDTVLRKTMGDNYMTPIKFLNSHSYPCYKGKQQELLDIFKVCGAEPPAFLFE